MAPSNLLILLLLFLFAPILPQIRADDAGDGLAVGSDESKEFHIELNKLTSKIQSLESLVLKKTEEIRIKDEIIAKKEKTIAEKEKTINEESENMDSLQNEVDSLKDQGLSDANDQVQTAHTWSHELEEQVERLQLELEQKTSLMEAFENRSKELEKNMLEMNPKLHDLQRITEEQKTKLDKTERTLKLSEEELLKTKNEAKRKIKELTEAHSAWLPSWLIVHMSSGQSYVAARWKKYVKPVFDAFIKKKKAKAGIWAESHIGAIKTKLTRAVKKQWVIVINIIEPHVQLLTKKTKEVYTRVNKFVTPYVNKIKAVVNPHLQVAKKFCEPYIDKVAFATKPYIDKVQKTMKPYTNAVVKFYAKFLVSANKFRHRILGTDEESKKSKIARSIPTKKFVWFLASVLLALPTVVLFKTLSAMVFGPAKKPIKTNKTGNARRKAKKAHSNK